MYIELILPNKVYRGELLNESSDSITFRDLLTNDIFTIEINGIYTLYKYIDLTITNLKCKVEHIKRSYEEKIFSDYDTNLIANTYDAIKMYHVLHTLRSLGLEFNSLDQLTLPQLKERIWLVVEREYNSNLNFINNDNDLNTEESRNLIAAIDRAKSRYQSILQTTDSIIKVFKAYPPMFNENLSYISNIIRYIEQDAKTPDHIRTI
jgi:hypothetical protein